MSPAARLALAATALLGGAAPAGAQAPARAFATLGTDVPYQYYGGVGVELAPLTLTYRAGLLARPYPATLTALLRGIGLDALYADLIDASFASGWMNTLSVQLAVGRRGRVRVGLDLRHDRVATDDTSFDVIAPLLGPALAAALAPPGGRPTVGFRVASRLTGGGLRGGYDLPLGRSGRHALRLELSLAKYVESATTLALDGEENAALSALGEDILARDVFGPYGFVGGIGVGVVSRVRPPAPLRTPPRT